MGTFDEIQKLLKNATAKKKDDIDGAIECLKEAYKLSEKKEDYALGLQSYLRLPKYLLLAGKNDDAYGQLSLLLSHGYPWQNKEFLICDHSEIYKAMSQQLEKENEYLDAISKYAMHLVADLYHMILRNKKEKEEHEQFVNMHKENDIEWDEESYGSLTKVPHFNTKQRGNSIEEELKKKLKKFKMEKKTENLLKFIKKYLEIEPKNVAHSSTIISDFEIKVQQILK